MAGEQQPQTALTGNACTGPHLQGPLQSEPVPVAVVLSTLQLFRVLSVKTHPWSLLYSKRAKHLIRSFIAVAVLSHNYGDLSSGFYLNVLLPQNLLLPCFTRQ